MHKILVFGSILMLAGGAYAADDDAMTDSSPSTSQAEQANAMTYDFAASKLIGQDVDNEAGDQIGSISDVIVDEQDQVTHAIIGVGGFLGVGEREVAVPFDELQIQGDDVVYPGGTEEQLSELPEFEYKEDRQQASAEGTEQQQTATAPSQ